MKKIVKYLSMPIACLAVCGIAAVGNNQSGGEAKTKLSAAVLNADVTSMTFEEAIAALKENSSKVVKGNVSKTVVNADGETPIAIDYEFINGENGRTYAHYTDAANPDTENETKAENWYMTLEDGSIYGLWNDSNTPDVTYNENELTADVFDGYGFSIGDNLKANGLENFIVAMYNCATDDTLANTNVETQAVNMGGRFLMAFDYVSTLYYHVEVMFQLDANGILTNGGWTVESWWNNQTKDDEGNWMTTEVEVEGEDGTITTATVPAGADWSGTYVASHAWNDESEYWYLVDGEMTNAQALEKGLEKGTADEVQSFTFTQSTEGEVTNSMMDYRMTSMKVTDAEGNAMPATLEMETGSSAYWNVTDIAPSTASTKANKISVVLDEDAASSWAMVADFYAETTDWNTGTDYTNVVKISAYKVGTYNVSIELNGVEVAKTVITVKNPLPKTLNAATYVDNGYGSYTQAAMGKTYSMYAGTSVVIGGMTDNTKADASTEISVLGTDGNVANCYTVTEVSYGGNTFNAIVFAPTAVGTYTINLYSTVVEELEASVTVTVNEAPSLADILTGEYDVIDDMSGEKCGSVVFADGKATIALNVQTGMDWETYQPIYTALDAVYVVDVDGDNLFTLEGEDGSAVSLKVNDAYELVVVYDQNYGTGYPAYEIEFATEKVESEVIVPGEGDSSSEEVSSEEESSEEEVESSEEEVESSEAEVESSEAEVESSEAEVGSSEEEVVSSEEEVVSSEEEVVSSEEAPASSSEEEEESESKKGCGSVVGGIACGIAALGLCAVAVLKKKEN